MWHTALLVNSAGVLPLTFVFAVYSSMYAILFWDWQLFFFAAPLLVLALVAQAVIAIVSESGH